MKTDIEIASGVALLPIAKVADKLSISADSLFSYGNYMAKVDMDKLSAKPNGKLILVTAINPTAGGEGKTTISIGLADGLQAINKKVCLALREPSLGPVFGMKGGATGGGYAQIAPMDDINLHFTGDLHAITSANNLLCAMVDNHIYWGNQLDIAKVSFHRCIDMNDRALRYIHAGINYNDRDDSFDITAASEVMAVLTLSQNLADLKAKLGQIVVGKTSGGQDVTAAQLGAADAMAILLKDAIKPNLVQTLEGVPAFVHGGPFANIAHGCNSIIATKAALSVADYVVTEAGFGADLGAEKFLDIKCRTAKLSPDAVVIVATIRALKCAGGKKEALSQRDDNALSSGIPNLVKHIENITKVFNLRCVVAINRFETDTDQEIELLTKTVESTGASVVCATVWANGGKGALQLAQVVATMCDMPKQQLKFAYDLDDSIEQKIAKIAKKIYGADGVIFTENALKKLEKMKETKWEKMPVCIAKTQYSFSDNPVLVGAPSGFNITVRDFHVRGGAGFVVALAGEILLMPGLSRLPNAVNMSIEQGKSGTIIKGLF